STSATNPPAATGAPSVTPTDEATSEEPTTEAPTTEEPTTDEPTTEEPTTELDRTVAIRVLNATQTRGLAGSRAAMLTEAGWTNAVGGNFPGDSTKPAGSAVWYRSTEIEAEAKQLAKDLGLSDVT